MLKAFAILSALVISTLACMKDLRQVVVASHFQKQRWIHDEMPDSVELGWMLE